MPLRLLCDHTTQKCHARIVCYGNVRSQSVPAAALLKIPPTQKDKVRCRYPNRGGLRPRVIGQGQRCLFCRGLWNHLNITDPSIVCLVLLAVLNDRNSSMRFLIRPHYPLAILVNLIAPFDHFFLGSMVLRKLCLYQNNAP